MMRTVTTKFALAVVFCLLVNPELSGQFTKHVSKVGTTAAAFLEIGVGARALGMGEAFVSVADDVTAVYWNPAGIAAIDRTQAAFFHSPWLADISFNHAAAVMVLSRADRLAIAVTNVNMNDMMVRTIQYPEGTGEEFGVDNLSLSLSYARRLTNSFSLGFSLKHIQEQIWHMSASSVAADIGIRFITADRGLKIGMSISNFGQGLRLTGRDAQLAVDIDKEKAGNNDRIDAHLDTWSWPLPMVFRFGLSGSLIDSGLHRLILAVDAVHPNNNVEYVNVGAEYSFNRMVSVRIGHSTLFMDSAEQGLSLGAGLNYPLGNRMNLTVDYVSRAFGAFDTVPGFSVGLTF